MENFLYLFSLLLLGVVLQSLKTLPSNTALALNKFIIYIPLPAMIFLQIPKLTFSLEMAIPIMVAWSVMISSALIIFFLSKTFSFSKEVTGALLLVGVLTNSSFLGIPIINNLYGEGALPYVMVYDQLGTFIAFSTYGTFIVAYYSSHTKMNILLVGYKIITFPPFILLFVALVIPVEFISEEIETFLSLLASTIVPLALIAVGLQLQLKLSKEDILPFSTALVVKLFIAPIIAILLCNIFSWENLAGKVSILEAAMAPMITAGAMASMAGLAPRLSAAIVGYGVVISFFTIYFFYLII